MNMFPREIAEERFKAASAEAALFELRLRMFAGTLPNLQSLPIDENLSNIRDLVVKSVRQKLNGQDEKLLRKATTLRNKMLHCEFSAARARLNDLSPRARDGEITRLSIEGLSSAERQDTLRAALAGQGTGGVSVSSTKTKTLSDVYGWLLEFQQAEEFVEAESVFIAAMSLLDRLGATQP